MTQQGGEVYLQLLSSRLGLLEGGALAHAAAIRLLVLLRGSRLRSWGYHHLLDGIL